MLNVEQQTKKKQKRKKGGREGEGAEKGKKAKGKERIPRCKKEIKTKISAGC